MKRITTLFLIGMVLTTLGAMAQTPEAAAEKLDGFLDRFPDLGPGYAVVVVTPNDVLLRHVDGVRRAGTGEPLTEDTPIYIASQTKAYVGMLAARLDAEGIFSLDDRITDHWPNVKFPGDVKPSDWTMRDLLAHKVPIEVGYITFMEAYVTELASSDYPDLIAKHAEVREAGFQYDNLGYNIWAAILETATGKSWRTWLDEKLFSPLKLEHTSSRTSDYSLNDLSWNHIWQGEEHGWHEVRPKTDAMMQSAGGLVTSINDMATWLQLNLQGSVLGSSGITQDMVSVAHTSAADVDPTARNAYELPCAGYALGWNICDFEGRTLYIHGGGYTGARTMMAFSPDMGAGIGVFSNSDNMTGWLTSRTTVQFFQYLIEHEKADHMANVREEVYPQRIARLLEARQQRLEDRRGEEKWGGWIWEPTTQALAAFEGTYQTDDPYEKVIVKLENGELVARMGGLASWLTPAKKDLFGGFTDPFSGPEAIQFVRDGNGGIVGFEWDGDLYSRQ